MKDKSLKEKLEDFCGTYVFDFSRQEDCDYVMEEYGGEENMKKKYPRTYESLLNSIARDTERANSRAAGASTEKKNMDISVGPLTVQPPEHTQMGVSAQEESSDDLCELSTNVHCFLIDEYKKVAQPEAADEWKGITIQTKIKEKYSSEYLMNTSIAIRSANKYDGDMVSLPYRRSEINNKRYQISATYFGVDPMNYFEGKTVSAEVDIGDVEIKQINNIVVEDPSPKNSVHAKSEEIVMLYGRTSEQYNNADYKGGDYYNNAFDQDKQKVHLLIPMKGYILLNEGVTPEGLKPPDKTSEYARPKATYDYKEQKFTYREDIQDDQKFYEKMKHCFDDKSIKNKILFDIQIPEAGYSALDWHSDVDGIQNGEPKTIMLKCVFTYYVKDQLGHTVEEQISIKSETKDFMVEAGIQYYKYKQNTVYIPPITVYWGCFAGDVEITMADGTKKRVRDIIEGDKVAGCENKSHTVESIVTGQDKSIYLIETDHGSIKVSGGHPMMCDGSAKRVSQIEVHDRINLADGGLAEVMKVSVVEFNDTVYNFTFEDEEEGVYLIANGFYAGDLKMQNTKKEQKKREYTQADLELIEEVKRFVQETNS